MDPKPSKTYRVCTPVVDAEYGVEDGPQPSVVITEAVAEAAGVAPEDLPRLHEFVDLDAVDALFEHGSGPDGHKPIFRFTVETWEVFVRGDGRVRVCDMSQPTDPSPVFAGYTV